MQSSLHLPHGAALPLRRSVFDFAGLLLLVVVMAVVAGSALWHFWFVNRIYYGVSVAGVPVGGMTRASALERLDDRFAQTPLAPLSLHYGGQHWPLSMAQVPVQADLLSAVNQAYLVGREGDLSARMVQQILTVVRGHDVTPPLGVEEEVLRTAIAQLAPQVNRPGRAAGQIGDVSIPAQATVTVDVEQTTQATLAALRTSLWNQTIQAPFVVQEETPVALAPAPATASAPALLRPLRVRDERSGLEFAIDAAVLNKIRTGAGSNQLDESALADLLAGWAAQIDLTPRDARLHFNPNTGGVTVMQTSASGRKLDIDATASAVREAFATGSTQARLVVEELAPAVDANRIAEMGIRELVASGTTYFKGSSAARIRNIEVAAEKFEGVVIPPNGIFSFNQIVENVTSANDFEDSLIIWGDQTVVGVGGGVCQVSTTVFRAAYNGGMPIVERYNHGYIVDWYGEPGLDATIFTPSVDFRFRNDTGAHLLIDPVVDSANGVMTFNFYGTKPNRVVTIGTPVKSDIKQPEPATFTVDAALAPGQRKQVEWEKPGMTVTVQRTIVENGTTRTDTLTSRYVPWRAVYLVGPGNDAPAAPADAEAAQIGENGAGL
jgi:vancomycin resistance protein YoaR